MGLWSWLTGLFSGGGKSSSGGQVGADELEAPAAGLEGGDSPSGATMVLSTVPTYTAWLLVRRRGCWCARA